MALSVLLITGMATIGWGHISDGHHQDSRDSISQLRSEFYAYRSAEIQQNTQITEQLLEIKAALVQQNEDILTFYKEFGGALQWARTQTEASHRERD